MNLRSFQAVFGFRLFWKNFGLPALILLLDDRRYLQTKWDIQNIPVLGRRSSPIIREQFAPKGPKPQPQEDTMFASHPAAAFVLTCSPCCRSGRCHSSGSPWQLSIACIAASAAAPLPLAAAWNGAVTDCSCKANATRVRLVMAPAASSDFCACKMPPVLRLAPQSNMNRQQVAGHLGAANNSNVSAAAQHSSRQQVMAAASGSGRSQQSIAGQIGVTTNPQCSSSVQHAARVSVMNAASNK